MSKASIDWTRWNNPTPPVPKPAAVDPLSRAARLLTQADPPVLIILHLLLEGLEQHERTLAREFDPTRSPLQLETEINNCCERLEALENPDNPLYRAEQPPRPSVDVGGWQDLHRVIRHDCRNHGWTDLDGLMAWAMGRKAMLEARSYGARFPHDPEEDAS